MKKNSLSAPLLDQADQHDSDISEDADPILSEADEGDESEHALSEERTPREWTCEGAEVEPLSALPTALVCAACGEGWDEKNAKTIEATQPRRRCLDGTHEGPISPPKVVFPGSYHQMKSLSLDALRPLAEGGHPWAQCLLGRYYEGIQKQDEAREWYTKSAIQNFAKAQYRLGCLDQKLEYLEAAAEQGHADAQYETALMYGKGMGVATDFKLQYDWALKAAQQDHAKSQFLVAQCLLSGQGVPDDMSAALQWLKRSADCGECAAMLQLAQMFDTGVLGPFMRDEKKNPKEAAFWYQKALKSNPSASQRDLATRKLQTSKAPAAAPAPKPEESGCCCCTIS